MSIIDRPLSSTGRAGRSSWLSDDGSPARVANHRSGRWQLGDLDLSEYLDRYRDQRLVLIIAPIGEAEPATYTCGVCGWHRPT
jgi:hypothetical protein